jgi:membrane associated rhomboid family serine protease
VSGRCPLCQGALCQGAELGEGVSLLSPDPDALSKPRQCPKCSAPMAALRIGKTQGWVEKCAACELYWVEKIDFRTMEMLLKSHARQKAFQSMTQQERTELAQGLAEATHQDTGPDVGIAGAVLATAGVPLVDRVQGDRTPWMTWLYALALCAVYVATNSEALAYKAGSGDVTAAFTSGFAHFGVWHLAGNVLFLFVFGSAAEQKLPRWAYVPAVLLLAPVTTLSEAAFAREGLAIGGASGAIAGLIGMCLFLQPKARVTLGMPGTSTLPVRMPLWLYGIGWAALQGALFAVGIPGVAWMAHVSGFVMGLAIGFVFSRTART